MATARVSVCIPVYNGAAYLAACLDSIIAQTYAALEIVVVDDCSTDDSARIVAEYQSRMPSIRYVRNEVNRGLVGNWNRCVELASCDWIKFVFQDDVIAPTCIERLMSHAGGEPALITCRRDFIFADDVDEGMRSFYLRNQARIHRFFDAGPYASPTACQSAAVDHFGANLFGEPTSVMLHRSFFDRLGGFREGLINSCDLEYWIRVSTHTGAYYVPETLAWFRVHEGSASARNRNAHGFRKDVLDNLLLSHDFATRPVYGRLRAHAMHRTLPIDLAAAHRTMRHRAYAKADWARRDESAPDPRPMEELEGFYAEFPRLRVNHLAHLWWRLKARRFGRQPAVSA